MEITDATVEYMMNACAYQVMHEPRFQPTRDMPAIAGAVWMQSRQSYRVSYTATVENLECEMVGEAHYQYFPYKPSEKSQSAMCAEVTEFVEKNSLPRRRNAAGRACRLSCISIS